MGHFERQNRAWSPSRYTPLRWLTFATMGTVLAVLVGLSHFVVAVRVAGMTLFSLYAVATLIQAQRARTRPPIGTAPYRAAHEETDRSPQDPEP